MYDNPAQAQFIDTYVPIPFEQLYRFGQEAKADVEKAYNDLSGSLNRWSEFRSPSAVDTKRWYDETVNKLSPVVEELSSNLDLLKTPEGRARIQSTINNVDYALLGNLQQSAQALTERQRINQELMMKGLYDPRWHYVDFAGYDTAANKAPFSDISPLAYQSWETLSDPYFEQLSKDGAHRFLKSDGLWDYYGVSREDVNRVAEDKLNEIYSSPYARRALEVAKKYGEIPEGMSDKEYIKQQVLQAQESRIYNDRRLNPLTDLNMRLSARTSGKGKETPPGQAPATLRNMMLNTAADNEQLLIRENPSIFPRTNNWDQQYGPMLNFFNDQMNEYKQLLNSGQIDAEAYNNAVAPVVADAEKYVKKQSDSYMEDVRSFFRDKTGIDPTIKQETIGIPTYYRGATETLLDISVPSSSAGFNTYNTVRATSKVTINNAGVPIEAYVRPNSQRLELTSDYLSNVIGSKTKMDYTLPASREGETRNLAKDLKNGRINNILVIPQQRMHNYVDPKTGEKKFGQIVEVKISRSSLINAGYDPDEIDEAMEKKFGVAPEVGLSEKIISQETIEGGHGYESEGGWFSKKQPRTPGAFNDDYFTIYAVDPILGKDADTFAAEQLFMQNYGSAAKAKEEYEGNQVDTFFPEGI